MTTQNDWTRNLRLRQLQMLERLCEVGTITQVAQEYQLTQPALSKWLRDFEESLGVQLFRRHARGLTPLPIALELARQAKAIGGRMTRVRQLVEQMVGEASAQVSIGVNSMVAVVFLPLLSRLFHERYPKASLQVVEGSLDILLPRLRQGELDLVIGRVETGQVLYGLEQERLCHVPICLACCQTHPLAQKQHVSWQEALRYPWVAPGHTSPIREQLEMGIERLGLHPPTVLIESNSVSTMIRLLPGTNRLALMSALMVESMDLTTTVNVPWVGMGMDAQMNLVWRDDEDNTPALYALMDCAREQAKQLA